MPSRKFCVAVLISLLFLFISDSSAFAFNDCSSSNGSGCPYFPPDSLPAPVPGSDYVYQCPSAPEDFEIMDSWKSHFPFDLVFPLIPSITNSSQPTNLTTGCQKINLFGQIRDLCAPMMLAKVAKWVFILKIVVDSIINL